MRRELRFKNFDDVRAELERLEKGPVETTGQWSFFQILSHCAKGIEGTMKGIDREMSWWTRHVKGPLFFRACAAQGFIPSGIGGKPGVPVERIEGDEKVTAGQLRKALEDFEKFEGKLSTHPRMGKLSKKEWTLFHSWHLANHLGNAKPKD